MFTLVKFTSYTESMNSPGWHLVQDIGSGEHTICGIAYPDFDTEERKITERRINLDTEITCQKCKKVIKWFKSLNKKLLK